MEKVNAALEEQKTKLLAQLETSNQNLLCKDQQMTGLVSQIGIQGITVDFICYRSKNIFLVFMSIESAFENMIEFRL